jgi:hypothetical protein
MPSRIHLPGLGFLLLALALVAGCAGARGKPTVNARTTGATAVVKAPSVIYVTDFYLPPTMIQLPQTLPEKLGVGGGRVARVRQDLREVRGDDPTTTAKKLVRTLGEKITTTLNQAGYRAEYRPGTNGLRTDFFPTSTMLPPDGWLLGGWFEQVQEPNRAGEATVGFGAGAGQSSIAVVVSDLAGDPRQPFLVIGSESAAKRMPGGLVALNPYAMAAKFVLSRGETEREVKALGAAIASAVVEYIQRGTAAKSVE